MRFIIMVALFLVGTTTQADEKFLPLTFLHSKLINCGVGGGHDGYAEAFVIVQYQTGPEYTVTIAKRASAWEAIEDCIAWYKSLKGPLNDAAKQQ